MGDNMIIIQIEDEQIADKIRRVLLLLGFTKRDEESLYYLSDKIELARTLDLYTIEEDE